jgi:hypothetical protein
MTKPEYLPLPPDVTDRIMLGTSLFAPVPAQADTPQAASKNASKTAHPPFVNYVSLRALLTLDILT